MDNLKISNRFTPFIFIALVAMLAFWPTLKVGFMWDDHQMIEKNPFIQSVSISHVLRAFHGDVFDGKGDAYFRPLQTLFNMADHAVWGLRPFGYHLTNLMLHIFASWLLFLCLKLIFEDEWRSLIVSLMFTANPIVVEQLLIIAGRAELMAAMFTFAAMVFAFQKSRMMYVVSLFIYLCACFSKESGIVMPLFLALAGWANPALRISWQRYIGYGLVGVCYLFLRSRAVESEQLALDAGAFLIFFVRDFPTIVITYLRILLLPFDLHSHRRMVFHQPWMILSPLLLLGFFGLAWMKNLRWVGFSLGWFLIGFLPKLPLLASNSLMLDHWAYLSGVGLFVVIAVLSRRWYWVPFVCIFLWIGFANWNIGKRNTNLKLYSWAMKFPTSSIVRYNLGLLHYQNGDIDLALPLFRESRKMNSDNPSALNGEALALWKLGKKEEAVQLLTEGIDAFPKAFELYVNRALILRGKMGLRDLEWVLQQKPDNEFALKLKEELLKEK